MSGQKVYGASVASSVPKSGESRARRNLAERLLRDGPQALDTAETLSILSDIDEDDQRLELLHKNVRKYGTISNTVAAALPLTGTIGRLG